MIFDAFKNDTKTKMDSKMTKHKKSLQPHGRSFKTILLGVCLMTVNYLEAGNKQGLPLLDERSARQVPGDPPSMTKKTDMSWVAVTPQPAANVGPSDQPVLPQPDFGDCGDDDAEDAASLNSMQTGTGGSCSTAGSIMRKKELSSFQTVGEDPLLGLSSDELREIVNEYMGVLKSDPDAKPAAADVPLPFGLPRSPCVLEEPEGDLSADTGGHQGHRTFFLSFLTKIASAFEKCKHVRGPQNQIPYYVQVVREPDIYGASKEGEPPKHGQGIQDMGAYILRIFARGPGTHGCVFELIFMSGKPDAEYVQKRSQAKEKEVAAPAEKLEARADIFSPQRAGYCNHEEVNTHQVVSQVLTQYGAFVEKDFMRMAKSFWTRDGGSLTSSPQQWLDEVSEAYKTLDKVLHMLSDTDARTDESPDLYPFAELRGILETIGEGFAKIAGIPGVKTGTVFRRAGGLGDLEEMQNLPRASSYGTARFKLPKKSKPKKAKDGQMKAPKLVPFTIGFGLNIQPLVDLIREYTPHPESLEGATALNAGETTESEQG
jgi:hypothetical protein